LLKHEKQQQRQATYLLDPVRRRAVLDAFLDVCDYRRWTLIAAHIRSTHVHVLVESPASSATIVRDLKAYASRRLNHMQIDPQNRRRWTANYCACRVPSQAIDIVIDYILNRQGLRLEFFDLRDQKT
jgi:REP element-mobilizing transposase RayT